MKRRHPTKSMLNSGITKMQSLLVTAVVIIAVIGILVYFFGPSLIPVSEGKRLYRMTLAFPTQIDPAVVADASSNTACSNLYDRLIYQGHDEELVPSAATGWDVAPDNLKWTFSLRKGIMFHDGTEMKAEDVVFSMERLLEIGEGPAYIYEPFIESVTAVDDYTIEFLLKQPFGPFVGALSKFFIVNKDLLLEHIETPGPYGDHGDYGKDWLLYNDAGSGAYKVKEFRREEVLKMELYEDYWDVVLPNAPEEIHQIGTTEPIQVRAMMNDRELEMTDKYQTDEALEVLDNIEGVDIYVHPTGPITYSITLNTQKPPLDDIHVRKAMFYAFDYEALKGAFNQYWGAYGDFMATNIVTSTLPGAHPNFTTPFQRNLTRAMEELEKSKYYGQLDDYVVEHHWVAEVPAREKISLLFASSMADIGITVQSVKTPWLTLVEEYEGSDTHAMSIGYYLDYYEALSELKMRYHSSTASTIFQNAWLLNETIDAMIDEAEATSDQEARFEKEYEIQEQVMNMYAEIPLVEWVFKQAYQFHYVDLTEASKLPLFYDVFAFCRLIEVFPEKRSDLIEGSNSLIIIAPQATLLSIPKAYALKDELKPT